MEDLGGYTMLYETISISVPGGDAALTVYAPDNTPEIDPNRLRRAVVMCPGGGYSFTSDREAEPVALQLLAADLCVFVLRYAVAPVRYPVALTQLAAAVRYVRENAARYHVQADKVAVMGYSAGGHLAASLGVRWNEPWLGELLQADPRTLRPDGMVLCYPVISAGAVRHSGSFANLTGSDDPAVWQAHSLENLVSERTPRAFLWHTFEDQTVPVENSLLFFSALRRCGVPSELHIYPQGVHGLSLATELTAVPGRPDLLRSDAANWLEMAVRWLKQL